MDTSWVWDRVESLQKTPDSEAATLLRDMLGDLQDRRGDVDTGFLEIVRTVTSAMHRVDHRDDPRDVILDELRSDGKHNADLNQFLSRLIDLDHPNRFFKVEDAIAEFPALMDSLRTGESEPFLPKPSASAKRKPATDFPAQVTGEISPATRKLALVGLLLVVLTPVGLLVFKTVSENSQARNPRADERLEDTQLEFMSVEASEKYRMTACWAAQGRSASSNGDYLEGVLSWPDAYSDEHVTDSGSWRAYRDDEGVEWIELLWNIAIETERILIVEAEIPGAIIAVDVISDPRSNSLGAKKYIRLWEGSMPVEAGSRVAVLRLAQKRSIEGIRLVLDTSVAPGRNRIDAVGLLPVKD